MTASSGLHSAGYNVLGENPVLDLIVLEKDTLVVLQLCSGRRRRLNTSWTELCGLMGVGV